MDNLAKINPIASREEIKNIDTVISLEERILQGEDKVAQGYATLATHFLNEKADLKSRSSDLNRLTNPLTALEDQKDWFKHNIKINLLSALVKKAVTTVETFLRA